MAGRWRLAAWWTTLALLLVPWTYLPHHLFHGFAGGPLPYVRGVQATKADALAAAWSLVLVLLACLDVLGVDILRRRRGTDPRGVERLVLLTVLLVAYHAFMGFLAWGRYETA